MKRFPAWIKFAAGVTAPLLFLLAARPLAAQDLAARAQQLERQGDPAAAQRLFDEAVRQGSLSDADTLARAQFLDRYNRPEARALYTKLAAGSGLDAATKRSVLRRLIALDLLAGDRASAAQHLAAYSAAGGTGLPATFESAKPEAMVTADIPGPIASFNRMAALSPDLPPEDVLPALARNIVTNGYQAANSQEGLDQTEYLKLIFRYLSQARELDRFAGTEKVVQIETCDSPKTGELLKILGYRMRGACGADVVLETVNASRAFLTIDSGFPLADLEQALRTNRPFTYKYKPTAVPVQYGPEYWTAGKDKDKGEFIDHFMSDPALCRLYLGLSKLDRTTADELKKSVPVQRLRAFAHVLDFFGGMLINRNGKIATPGSARSEAMWAELAGAPPSQGPAFIERLLAKDDGWLNSYFDALSRIEGPVQTYLTEPERMKRFYTALKGKITSPGPARPVFRANTDLMLLTTRLRMEPDGKPHLPGGLEVWKNLFVNHPHGKYDGKLTKAATNWKDPDDIIEALFALCRKAVENEPLKIFMALTDVNRYRAKPLEPATVDRLARNWRLVGSQYPVLTEVATLSDAAIIQYVDAVSGENTIKDQALRANAAGTMQSLIGIWQIFARNQLIPADKAEAELVKILTTFTKVKEQHEVFQFGIASARSLLAAAGAGPRANVQDRMLDLLAGTAKPRDEDTHQQMVQEMMRIFEAQKLVSLKLLADIGDQLDAMGKGEKFNPATVNRLQARMAEFQLPRAAMTSAEKNALSFGFWTEKHIESQRKMNLRAMLEKPGVDAGRLNAARAQLAPLLRDTLVGFNYLYYAPPGAQLLKTNPVFVRSHDFLGVQGSNQTWRPTEVLGSGWPSSAGGRLVGSMSGVAYALAEAEQNFLIPTREQALIWGDLVPQMILSAKIPRFWQVSADQMHWVGLHLRQGEGMLAEAAVDPALRKTAMETLGKLAAPSRTYRVAEFLAQGDLRNALDNVTAAELYMLGAAGVKAGASGPFADEIKRLSERVNTETISRAFGTPKPTLTTSFRTEILNLRTFPTLMGYSSRIMAESWESNLLYYAALADELHLNPDKLNLMVPEWTQQTVERIFATHLEDWPALLRSLRTVGEDVRNKVLRNKTAAGGERSAGGQ